MNSTASASRKSTTTSVTVSVANKSTASYRKLVDVTHRVTRNTSTGAIESPNSYLTSSDPRITRWDSAPIEEAVAFIKMPHTSWKSVLSLSLLPFGPRPHEQRGSDTSSMNSSKAAHTAPPVKKKFHSDATDSSTSTSAHTTALHNNVSVHKQKSGVNIHGRVIRGPTLAHGLRCMERLDDAEKGGEYRTLRKPMNAEDKVRQWKSGNGAYTVNALRDESNIDEVFIMNSSRSSIANEQLDVAPSPHNATPSPKVGGSLRRFSSSTVRGARIETQSKNQVNDAMPFEVSGKTVR